MAYSDCGLNEGSHSEILRIRIFVSEEYFKFGGVGVVLPHPTLISPTTPSHISCMVSIEILKTLTE